MILAFLAGAFTMVLGVLLGAGVFYVSRHGFPTLIRKVPTPAPFKRPRKGPEVLPEPPGDPPPAAYTVRDQVRGMETFDQELVKAQIFEDFMAEKLDSNGRVINTEWLGT